MWGLAWSGFWGDPRDMLAVLDVADGGDGVSALVTVRALSGYGDSYWMFVVDGRVELRWLPEAETLQFLFLYDTRLDEHAIDPFPLGDWPTASELALESIQAGYYADKARYIRFAWTATPDIPEAFGDSQQLSNWSLTGLNRQAAGRKHAPTQLEFDVVLTNASGTYTLTLQNETQVLASGSRVGDGTLTLTAQGESGISGTVDVAYTADLTLGTCVLRVRWPARYEIHCATAALSFPRTAEATVYDDGNRNDFSHRYGPLMAGTYHFVIRAFSDTQTEGSNTTEGTLVVPGRPQPPSTLHYLSGGYAATVIQFTKSTTTGATYRYYDSALDEPVDLHTAVSVSEVDNGDGTISATLPAIASGTGTRRVCVVAVESGLEDGYNRTLNIEYTAGVVEPLRPSTPTTVLSAKSGLVLTAGYTYDATGAAGVATQVRLYARAEDGTITTLTTQDIASGSGVVSGTISGTVSAEGWYQFRVAALTAAGGESAGTDWQEAEWLSADVPAAPTVTAQLVL